MRSSLENVQAFLDKHADVLGAVVSTGARAMLAEAIVELSEHIEAQNGQTRAARSAVARRITLRQALLRDHMIPIARIAKLELAGKPELISLGLPRNKPSVERLAGLAAGMAQAAAPYADVFIHAGLKPDFIQALRTAADDLLQALKDRTQCRSAVETATSGLRTTLLRGRKVVLVLDAFVRSALVGNKDLLEGWQLVKRIPRSRRGPKELATPITSTRSIPSGAAAA
ncbi:MAG: hypothetical protein V4550_03265 [Gemmatimonadota bacterium]